MEQQKSDRSTDVKKKRKMLSTKVLLALAILFALTSAAGTGYSVVVWKKSNDLNASLSDKDNEIAGLNKHLDELGAQLDSLTAKEVTTDDTKTIQTLFDNVEVGQSVETESGTLTINSYEKTSFHDIASSYTSIEQNLLLIRMTLSNTTGTTQTYSNYQFKFIDNAKVQNDTYPASEPNGFVGYLHSATLDPDGSLETKIVFKDYDHKAGVLQWTNSAGQKVRIILPSS